MIGHKNEALKRIGVSKHRMMSQGSVNCAVCGKKLQKGSEDGRHLCTDHIDWELVVVDGQSPSRDIQYLLGHENDSEAV